MHHLNPQDKFIKRRPLNLRLRIVLKLLLIKPVLDHPKNQSITDPARPSGPLLRTSLTRPTQLQILHSTFQIIFDFFSQTKINHIFHAFDSDGGLSNVGGDD